jgi:hypothetical protein
MSIIIALLLGGVFGAMLGALWRAEEMQALQKANARLIEERDNAQNLFRTKQRMNVVN